jgi:cystathionine beta-lyase
MIGTISMCGENIQPVINSVRTLGYNISPDDAYLALRGLRTLNVRLKRHEANALKIAKWLSCRPEIDRVLHPALPSCPGHDIWQRDFTGSNGLFGVVFKPLSENAMHAFIDGLELFSLGGSWGGYESLLLPTDVTRTVTEWKKNKQCIRFHIGLEDPDDLIGDIESGLKGLQN